jgi:hypothetical protein
VQELLKAAPDIIKEARQNDLGIIALMVMAVLVVAICFFHKAEAKVKVPVFLLLFGAFFWIWLSVRLQGQGSRDQIKRSAAKQSQSDYHPFFNYHSPTEHRTAKHFSCCSDCQRDSTDSR